MGHSQKNRYDFGVKTHLKNSQLSMLHNVIHSTFEALQKGYIS